MRIFAAVVALGAAMCAGAASATCTSFPYTFVNGSTADASQLMADLNYIPGCTAPIASPAFTGSVGIGTTTPETNLDVEGPATFGGTGERISLNTSSLGFNRRVFDGHIYTSSAFAYQFQHLQSTTNTSDILELQLYNPSGATLTNNAFSLNAAGNVAVNSSSNTSYTFYVNGSAAGTGSWINASDARLKTAVVEISDALSLVERLRGVRFRWRPVEDRAVGKTLDLPVRDPQIGFIAQEVAAVVPEAVSAPKSANDFYGVKEADLIPLLVEAIKEQQGQIAELRGEVAALKGGK